MSSLLSPPGFPSSVIPLGDNAGGHVRAYFLSDSGILIDTLSEDNAETLIAQLHSAGYGPRDIHHILYTHGHESHERGGAEIKSRTGAPTYAHAWEADVIRNKRKADPVSFPSLRQHPRHPVVWGLQLGLHYGRGSHHTCEVDQYLKDGDTVGPLMVIHTPGHTTGHLAFYHPVLRVLFAGDAVTTWPGSTPGPWEGFTTNQPAWDRSIGVLVDLDSTWLCTGHGNPVGNSREHLRRLVK